MSARDKAEFTQEESSVWIKRNNKQPSNRLASSPLTRHTVKVQHIAILWNFFPQFYHANEFISFSYSVIHSILAILSWTGFRNVIFSVIRTEFSDSTDAYFFISFRFILFQSESIFKIIFPFTTRQFYTW